MGYKVLLFLIAKDKGRLEPCDRMKQLTQKPKNFKRNNKGVENKQERETNIKTHSQSISKLY